MIEYEDMNPLKSLLKVKKPFQKHWGDKFGWDKVEGMHICC
jgi:hypothetical protein